ncbi:hypothetical protein AVDCRST_MAG84-2978 [uncultured Microcoleus sp.]|uniref:Uncharacterized protein n=1 Tax=uncultured Microcoleus sp. TaxID=259945 RepID=A0A6J4MAQ8_9CYAN|nr:hypothetical protein AVDCRST_MAG84-2978 [uncultured Microcoleus sp.]
MRKAKPRNAALGRSPVRVREASQIESYKLKVKTFFPVHSLNIDP